MLGVGWMRKNGMDDGGGSEEVEGRVGGRLEGGGGRKVERETKTEVRAADQQVR